MKNYNTLFFTSIVWACFIFSACEKDAGDNANSAPVYIPPPPRANVGPDLYVDVPMDSAFLSADISTFEPNPHTYLWKQLSGPNIASIEHPYATHTRVSNLIEGTYEFEFGVTNKRGASGKDTVTIFVQKPTLPGQKEVRMVEVAWICPFGCSIQIKCITCLVPDNKPFKIYLRDRSYGPWVEAIPYKLMLGDTLYAYSIENGDLLIYTNTPRSEKVDIKIVY